jgi:hypothetical protein
MSSPKLDSDLVGHRVRLTEPLVVGDSQEKTMQGLKGIWQNIKTRDVYTVTEERMVQSSVLKPIEWIAQSISTFPGEWMLGIETKDYSSSQPNVSCLICGYFNL